MKWALESDLSGRGLVQPIKELLSAAGQCARRGCALIKQLANGQTERQKRRVMHMHTCILEQSEFWNNKCTNVTHCNITHGLQISLSPLPPFTLKQN